jgi:hypothetical protein
MNLKKAVNSFDKETDIHHIAEALIHLRYVNPDRLNVEVKPFLNMINDLQIILNKISATKDKTTAWMKQSKSFLQKSNQI